ncbi:ankyrin repeat domain-containing protein [Paractinoplanes toevensis]
MFDLARSGGTEELIGNVIAGLPPNLTNDKGDTLLILAAYHNHVDTVIALLEQGADPNRVNDRGQSALSAAVFRQNAETVKALLATGADPAGGTPSALATAEFFELPEMAALLRGA